MPGERLGEQDLADLSGVSRTLVRKALMRLHAWSFVECGHLSHAPMAWLRRVR